MTLPTLLRHPLPWLLVAAGLLAPLAAVAATPLAPRTGILLVADPQLQDERFQESVILVIRHDARGTVGLVLNRPLGPLPPEVRRNLATAAGNIFWGGPVAALTVSGLCSSPCPGSEPVAPGLHLVRGDALGEQLRPDDPGHPMLRLFLGSASWAAQQLAREIARGDWHLVPATGELLFATEPSQLWPRLAPAAASPWI